VRSKSSQMANPSKVVALRLGPTLSSARPAGILPDLEAGFAGTPVPFRAFRRLCGLAPLDLTPP
jgi:hypothetical protein